MRAKRTYMVSLFMLLVFVVSLQAQEPVYWDVVQKIMNEAFEHSQVMENASWLCDVFGPRDAKSPSYIAAAKWAKGRLEEYGLSNAKLEPYEFGTGYVNEYVSVHMMKPQYMPIIAYPATWSAGTNGKVRGPLVFINFDEVTSEADLKRYRGKLRNAIVFTRPKQGISPHFEPMATRFTDEQLDEMAKIPVGPRVPEERHRGAPNEDMLPRQKIIDFVFGEGAVAIVRTDGRNDFGTVAVENTAYTTETRPWEENAPPPHTELVMAAEHYNRIMRILEKGIPVEMEVELRVNFTRGDPYDYNVVAEIPGTDFSDEVVMCGGHLQANPAGTGASDNAAGVAVSMEAVRILKAIGVKPRRTIRVALWGGHEMGNFGSRHYVHDHFGDVITQEYKPEHANFCAYFNMDGSGRIRGVNNMNNEEIRSIFIEWMKPLHNLGISHIIPEISDGEARAFIELGLPGFDFLQDRMDRRTYHSNMDVYDHLVPEDLMQASVVMATFVYHAAMRDKKLPRILPEPWDRYRREGYFIGRE
jgi:carboxypeptidase Q